MYLILAAPALGNVQLSTTPRLAPSFRPVATDYVSRCRAGHLLRVHVQASDGDRLAVGGHLERGGTFTTSVNRGTGQSVTVKVRSPKGTVTRYYIRCLPRGFPDWTIRRHGAPQAQWYVAAPVTGSGGYVAIFDAYGAPVWWRHIAPSSPRCPRRSASWESACSHRRRSGAA